MFVPEMFATTDPADIARIIHNNPLATLVSHGERGLFATHAPVLPRFADDQLAILECHFARANPHWKDLDGAILVIFQGAESYITPSWYPTKQKTGKVVPT